VPQMVASQNRQLGYALDSKFYNTDSFVNYVTSKLKTLTVDDVNRVIKDNLQTENIHYVFVTGDGEDMQKRLATMQTSPMVYNTDKPAELVAEDKVIADYKLAIPAKNIEVVKVDKVFQ